MISSKRAMASPLGKSLSVNPSQKCQLSCCRCLCQDRETTRCVGGHRRCGKRMTQSRCRPRAAQARVQMRGKTLVWTLSNAINGDSGSN